LRSSSCCCRIIVLWRPEIASEDPIEALDVLVTQIVESGTFRSAPMMRTLLKFLWNHRHEELSEYAVAVDVLGRPPSFDPKTDSSARVQVSRLRGKLREFYSETGDSFPLMISIPLGSHHLQWTYKKPPSPAIPGRQPIPWRYTVAAGAVMVAFSLICLLLFLRVRALEVTPSTAAQPLPEFWRTFVAGSNPVQIVVPSPLSFFWPDRGLNVRDLNVAEFSQWPSSPSLRAMAEKWGPPTLSQTYVGAQEMNAGIRLLRLLQGRVAQLDIIESRKFAADSAAAKNTIFLGMPRTAVYLGPISQKLNFYIERVEPDIIRNRAPRNGEPLEYKGMAYSADRIRFPGIIALLPPRPEHTRSLLLLGRSPVSMATMLSTSDGLRLIDEQCKKSGSPVAWEMVVEAEVYRGDTVVKIVPVAFRPIPAGFWNQ